MDCPKCTGTLQQQRYGDTIVVQRCDVCAGLWCTPEAIEAMKNTWMSEAVLDTGDPRIGDTLDKVGNISCPAGHGQLLRRTDPRQRHIDYEECPVCGGIYLDAGELTDLKHETVLDRLRTLLHRLLVDH